MDKLSNYLIRINSSKDAIYSNSYQLALNNTSDIGRIGLTSSKGESLC